MPNKVLRRDFNRDLAQMLLRDIQYQRSNYYYFLGGVTPWSGVGSDFTSDIPPTDGALSLDTSETNRYHRSEIVFSKKINPNDVSLMVNRYDWVPNIVWDQWDHTLDMANKKYFVMTDEYSIYKCLYNNEGAASEIKPSFRGLDPVTLSDGYIWKYMYNIAPFRFNRFRSSDFLPVQTSMSESFYNNGAVDSVSIISEGQNYTNVQQTSFVVVNSGATTGSGAAGELVVSGAGVVIGVTITNSGTGYTKGARVVIDDSIGFGAELEAVINIAGEITDVTVISGGIGYTDSSPVLFQTGFADLLPVVSRETGSIVDVKILDPGIGYSSPPAINIQTLSTGTGLYNSNPTALFESIVYDGKIKHINTIDPGVNYPVDTDTTISVDGDGVDASYFPVVYDGKIIDIIIENPGSRYSEINLTVNSASEQGSGAVLRGIITPSDYATDQAVIEQFPSNGIYGTKVLSPGKNYSPSTTITVLGNGVNCTANPIIINGEITKVIITDPGQGYTWAKFEVNDPLRVIESIPEEDQFSGYPILPPQEGHGKNAPAELCSSTVGIVTPLRSELELQSIIQDYRKFGILKNPLHKVTKNRYLKENTIVTYRVEFLDASTIITDEILTINNNKFKVFNVNDNYVDLIALDNDNYPPLGTMRATDGREYNSFNLLEAPDFDRYSGSLLYVSLEIPFSFSIEQSLSIKTYIQF